MVRVRSQVGNVLGLVVWARAMFKGLFLGFQFGQ